MTPLDLAHLSGPNLGKIKKHKPQTVKMSLLNFKRGLLVTVIDRDSLVSRWLSHHDGKVIGNLFFFFFPSSSAHSEICLISLGVQVQSGSQGMLKSALSTWLHMFAGVHMLGDRWARRSQWLCSCSERSLSGCWKEFSSDARPKSLPCGADLWKNKTKKIATNETWGTEKGPSWWSFVSIQIKITHNFIPE